MSDTDDSEPSTSYSRHQKVTSLRNLVSDDSDDEGFSQAGRHKKEDGTDVEDEEEDGASDEEEEEGLEGGTHEGSCLPGRDDGCETGDSDSSSGPPGAETCAICLGRIRGEVGSPEVCDHIFCLICILEWARTNATCPQDRKSFTNVSVQECFDGPVVRKVPIKKEKEEQPFIPEENPTYCEVCRECDREERLLLCDGCDLAYHLECLDPPLSQVPVEEWFCPDCADAHVPAVVGVRQEEAAARRPTERRRDESRYGGSPEPQRQQRQRQPRRIPRTRAAERVRQRIQHHRKQAKAAKRRRRKQQKRERIANGEQEDKRPPIKSMTNFSLFVSGDDDVDAEHAEDDYATQILSGEPMGPIYRDPATRRANAARLLHLNTFIPLPGYSGKTSTSIIDRVDTQTSQSEGDVLSSILQGQSIALTSSKKLTLTTDRKLTKQEGLEVELPESFGKENLVMSEPLASQKEDAKEKGERDEEGKDKEREGKDDKKREGENERRRDRVQEDDRRRERDGENKRRRERDLEEDRRRERDGEEFRRRWRDGEDSRRDGWRGDNGRRGDRNGYDRRGDYHREGGRYGFRFPPHRPPHYGRYFGHEPYRSREGSSQQGSSQSPLEDKRRSPPRLSYRRSHGQSSYRRDRDRYQSSPPHRRKFDSYRDYKKEDLAPPRHRDFEIGHRGFCRSNIDRRDYSRYDDDYRRSNGSSRRSDGDFRRYDGDSRRFESDVSRSDAESRHSEESLGRKRRSCGRDQEGESKRQNRSSGERGHRPSRRSKDWSRSRSPNSRSRSRSNSKSPSRHSERKTKSKTHSRLEGNNEISKHETTTVEVENETESSNKDIGASTQDGENLAHSKKSKHEHTKDLFASKWTEDSKEQTCKEVELPRSPRGKLEMETNDHEDEKDIIHTTVGSLKAVLDTRIKYEQEDLGKATSERIGNQEVTNSEDDHISLPSQSSDRKLHRHKSKYEINREKKEIESSIKQDLAHLFGDESHSEKKRQKLEYDCISDDDEEEKLDLAQKEKLSKGKSGDKHKKKHVHNFKQLFFYNDDEPTTLSLQSPTKEKQKEAFDLYDESFFFPRTEDENGKKLKSGGESNVLGMMSLPQLPDDPPPGNQEDSLRKKEKFNSIHKSLFTDKNKETTSSHHSNRKDSSHSTKSKSLEKDVMMKELKSKEISESTKSKHDVSKDITNLDREYDMPSLGCGNENPLKDNDWFQHTLDIIKNYRDSVKKHSDNLPEISKSSKSGSQDEVRTSHETNKTEECSVTITNKTKGSKESSASAKGTLTTGQAILMDLFGDIADVDTSTSSDADLHSVVKENKHKRVVHKSKTPDLEEAESAVWGPSDEGDKGNVVDVTDRKQAKCLTKDKKSESETVDAEKGRDISTTIPADPEATHSSSSTQEKMERKAVEKSGSGSKGGGKESSGSQHLKQPQKSALEAKVVGEVKRWLDPHYRDRSITKPEYKEIVAKCVTKVVSAECGDIIESEKMHTLVDGYVKLYKHRRTKKQQQLLSPQ